MNNIISVILIFSLSAIIISGNPLGIDADNDGTIANTHSDLHQSVKVRISDVTKLLDKLDRNKDGFINLEESGHQSAGRSRRQVNNCPGWEGCTCSVACGIGCICNGANINIRCSAVCYNGNCKQECY